MITVFTPTLNERPFIEAWYHNVSKYADEIVVVDTGSTDGTIEFLQSKKADLIRWPEKITPYDWPEGRIRNFALSRCHGDWIVRQDADELVGDEFIKKLPELLETKSLHCLRQLQFWVSPQIVRTGRRWDCWRSWRPFMWPNTSGFKYREAGNHSTLCYRGSKLAVRLVRELHPDIPVFHYHYIGKQKELDNRRVDFGQSGILCKTYFGKHPEETNYYNWFPQPRKGK